MRFASLGSGSRGNALLVQQGATCVMIDCGFSLREIRRRLARLQLQPEDLTALFITHEHGDHINGVGALARKYAVPVYATPGTFAAAGVGEIPHVELVSAHEPFTVDDLQIQPYPVPHDAKEPCQCVVSDGSVRLGVLTDSGSITQHIHDRLEYCDALVLECNHDEQMLLNSAYPQSLKYRIGGRLGHLSNAQAAGLLQNADMPKLNHIVAAHLSEKNNTPELARHALSDALGCEPDWIGVMDQQSGLPWRDV